MVPGLNPPSLFPVSVTIKIKARNNLVLRVLLGMCHQLGTEVTDGKEVIRPFNQLPVLLVEHWQAVKTQKRWCYILMISKFVDFPPLTIH